MFNDSQVKDEMVKIVKLMWQRGHANTTGVSISYKDDDGNIFLNQSGTGFRRCNITVDEILKVDGDGNLLESNVVHRYAPVNTIVHIDFYKNNPLAKACVHCHPPYSIVFACLGKSLNPFTLQSELLGEVPCIMVDDVALKKEYFEKQPEIEMPTGLHGRKDVFFVMSQVAQEAVKVLRPRFSEMKKHGLAFNVFRHGIFVFGRNLGEAFDNLERIESNAKAFLLAQPLLNER